MPRKLRADLLAAMLTLSYLAELADQFAEDLRAQVRAFQIGGKLFTSRPFLMGVINLSHDSWYRESVCLSAESALRRARILREQGADLIDIGAESTLPHAAPRGQAEQRSLLIPVVEELCRNGLIVSAETYHLEVARAALQAGAQVLNMTGTAEAEGLYRLAAEHDAAVILCYVEGPHARQVSDLILDEDPIPRMRDYFSRQVDLAARCGLEKIILDPGLGFYYRNLQDSAARVRRQMITFLNTFRLRTLGCPICHALPHAFEYFGEEVRIAEPFFALFAALGKTDLFRTHEVARVKAVLDTLGVIG